MYCCSCCDGHHVLAYQSEQTMMIAVAVTSVTQPLLQPDNEDDDDVVVIIAADDATADVDDDDDVLLWLLFPPPLWLQLHSVLSKSLVSVNGKVALQKQRKEKREKEKTLQQKNYVMIRGNRRIQGFSIVTLKKKSTLKVIGNYSLNNQALLYRKLFTKDLSFRTELFLKGKQQEKEAKT
ncbi:hypothetical protein FF38_06709 [Lucilia cuprina]|uniref:Uncharacterized protein n=1 Tax=Lucilia cuprina TaxID=7375 RepID=A0A0L0C3V8_LUCCU|nr:hypothetical protein FF38_06709 [Lucilia cuprina]